MAPKALSLLSWAVSLPAFLPHRGVVFLFHIHLPWFLGWHILLISALARHMCHLLCPLGAPRTALGALGMTLDTPG